MKKIKFLTIIACLLFLSANVSAETRLIEKVVKKGPELVIPYEKYELDNGLIVIVHEDHSDPIVHVDVTYHVGSAREQEGRSGFAHFFEHMMFQGSDHVGDEQHFKTVSEAGGTLNGTTNTDRTNYFETLPKNHLETALWLEADRMGFLLDAVTREKFEVQRETVKNERGQNYDNKPYGVAQEKINAALYPPGHPYSWMTIGYIEDLDRVGVEDLKKFFLRWYGPNNAVLTVAGDVDPKEVVKLAEKYFGSIPRGPQVMPQAKTPVRLDSSRYLSYEDNVRFPMLRMTFPTVPTYHPDEAPLDILSDILGGGKTALFYQNFVKTQKAVQASVNNPCSELAGQFQITVLGYANKSLAEMEALVKATMLEFEKRGVNDEDLVKYKANFESQSIGSLSSVAGKGSALATHQTFRGNPNQVQNDIDRYNRVTKEDVMRVYNTYIKNKPAVILSVYPKGKPDLVARPDNYRLPPRKVHTTESDDYKNLTYKKAQDTFDRGKKPAPGPNPVVKVPDYWTENFENGLKAISVKNDEVPKVTVELSIEAGHRYEDKSKSGVAKLLGDLLNESTTMHTTEQLNTELDKLGSSVHFSVGAQDINMTVTSLTKNLGATLKIAEEMLMHPKFDTTDFERLKKQLLEHIANQSTQPVVIVENVYHKIFYGNDHIMSVPVMGTASTVNSIVLEDVKKYYSKNFSPSISSLVVVGDVSKESILPQLEFLKHWKNTPVSRAPEKKLPEINKTKIYFVNKDNAPQSEIRIGYMALPYDATGEYYKLRIANFVLGGNFNSRLNLNLREDKAWTYGARSVFGGSKYPGPFLAGGGIKAVATDSAVVEFIKEIKKYADSGITPEELAFTKSSIGQADALEYETPAQQAGVLKRIITYNLGKNYVDKQNEILKNISKDEIDALAKKYLPYDKMNIIVVGDKANTFAGLSKLGYELIELDTDGNPVEKTSPGPPPTKPIMAPLRRSSK